MITSFKKIWLHKHLILDTTTPGHPGPKISITGFLCLALHCQMSKHKSLRYIYIYIKTRWKHCNFKISYHFNQKKNEYNYYSDILIFCKIKLMKIYLVIKTSSSPIYKTQLSNSSRKVINLVDSNKCFKFFFQNSHFH